LEERQRNAHMTPSSLVLLSSNSFWNIVNFRGALVEALVAEGYRVQILTPDVDSRWANAVGVKATEIAVDRSGLNPIVDALVWLNYVRIFRRERPRVFLSYTAKPNIYGSLAAQISGVESIPNVSGLGTAFIRGGLLSRFVTMLYRLAFRRSRIVFFQNPDDRELFVAKNIVSTGQARLLPGSGVDLERFAPGTTAPDKDQICFLFIGRLLGDKGVREFVEAARSLRADRPGWRFQLLGETDPDNRSGISSDEVRQWVDQGLVEHLGHAEDVRPHIQAATAVVLPSYREGMPRSLLEAAAMARPLIATDVPGNRQLVDHGVNGLLCEARNPQELAEAMAALGSMGVERRAQMGQASRAKVERSYGVDRVVAAYLEALAQLGAEARV